MFDPTLMENLHHGAYGPFIVIPVEGMDQDPIIGFMPAAAAAQLGLAGHPAAQPQGPVDTPARPGRRAPSARAIQATLFGACALTAAVAIISALEVWPVLDASRWGLDRVGSLCLSAAGIYFLAAIVYAGPRTWLSPEPQRVALDARLMAWGIIAVGVASSLALGLAVFAILLAALVLLALAVWLFRRVTDAS